MTRNETFKFQFFSPYSSGFSFQNSRQSRRSQIDMLSFLENIKSKTKFTIPSGTNIVYNYV